MELDKLIEPWHIEEYKAGNLYKLPAWALTKLREYDAYRLAAHLEPFSRVYMHEGSAVTSNEITGIGIQLDGLKAKNDALLLKEKRR